MPKKNLSIPVQRRQLRQFMREKRKNLSLGEQRLASKQLCTTLKAHCLLPRLTHVAIYLANDGEIDPSLFIQQLWKSKVRVYLPVLHPLKKNCLWFYRYTPNSKMKPNRFGIPEPDLRTSRKVPAWALSLTLFPLVAFDKNGGRLGMGGGFYDRTFAFAERIHIRKKKNEITRTPKLCGLAHEFQRVEKIPLEAWDVPLKHIASDQFFYRV